MGIPQVTDRIKEAPAHALRAVFSGFGQLLLAAERLRGQAGDPARQPASSPAGQGGPAAAQAAGPDQSPSVPPSGPPSARPAAEASLAESGKAQPKAGGREPEPATARWRSLDQTGNVRILSPDDPAEDSPLAPAAPVPAAAEAGTVESAEPAEAAAEPGTAEPIERAEPAEAAAQAGTAEPIEPAEAAEAAEAAGPELPVPGYDSLSLPSLRARLRNLNAGQLQLLIAYEREHAGRADVVAMFERRIAKLAGE